MKKRYSIPKEQCTCGISELYDNVAKIMGVSDLNKVAYDCRKLSITKKVLDCPYEFYHSENQSDETIKTCMPCMVQKQIWRATAMKLRQKMDSSRKVCDGWRRITGLSGRGCTTNAKRLHTLWWCW